MESRLPPVVLLLAGLAALPAQLAARAPSGVVAVELPPPDNSFRPGAGQDIAAGRCVICHSADYVYTQPPMAQDKWKATVTKMQKVFGCPVDDESLAALTAYLARQNGPDQ